MVEYRLEDFKNWLNEERNSEEKKTINRYPGHFQCFIEEKWENTLNEVLTATEEQIRRNSVLNSLALPIKKWINEVDKAERERERERERETTISINNMTESWKGFYTYLTQELGLKEKGDGSLDSVFGKAPGKYNELEKSIGWMLFWKSLENTVSNSPKFSKWEWSFVRTSFRKQTGTWTRTGTGTGTGTGTWTGTGTGKEKPLPNYETGKGLWDIFYNKHEVVVYFEPYEITQFNQILEDYRNFETSHDRKIEEEEEEMNYSIDEQPKVKHTLLKWWENKETERIEFGYTDLQEGDEGIEELVIDNYPNLKVIEIGFNNRRFFIKKLVVKNCPNLVKIRVSKSHLEELIVDECPNLFNLDVFENKLKILKVSNLSKPRILTELNTKIDLLEQQKTELETEIQSQKTSSDNYHTQLEKISGELNASNSEKITLTNRIAELEERLQTSNNSNQELANQKNQAEEQLLAITISAAAVSKKITDLETQTSNLEREKEFTEQKINNLEQEIQGLLKLKVQLEIDNENLTKNVKELKIEVGRQKDQISALQGEQQDLNYQLETLKGELNLTPESPNPEKQTLRQKISFFNDFLKRTREQNEQLEENIKKEQEETQTARQSLIELEEQLKGTSEDNKQQIVKLNQANQDLRKQIKILEHNVKLEKEQVTKLQKRLSEKSAELKKLGITLIKHQQTINQTQKEKKWWIYAFWIAIAIIGAGVLYFSYQKIRKYFF